jgi:prepilin-type N-terminal cleavage/methylation domain-containing protein
MNHKAFTLIELLVAVLIIGILAAIALPQYTKTVRLSRTSQALTMLNAILKAQEEYFLIHSEYTNNMEDLSITVPADKLASNMSDEDKKSNYYYSCWAKQSCGAGISNEDYPTFEFVGSYSVSTNMRGKKWCVAVNHNIKAKAICSALGATTLDNNMTYGENEYYLLN